MPNYIQKQKDELKWKIDHYFKDLDFDFSDFKIIYDYIIENKFISKVNKSVIHDILRNDKYISSLYILFTDKLNDETFIQSWLPKSFFNFYKGSKVEMVEFEVTLEILKIGYFKREEAIFIQIYLLNLLSYFIVENRNYNDLLLEVLYIQKANFVDIIDEAEQKQVHSSGWDLNKLIDLVSGSESEERHRKFIFDKYVKKNGLLNINKIIYRKIILPIYEHIVNNLDERHFLEQLLEKYKFRTEHFTKKNWEKQPKDEVKLLQPDLGLFLVDQGIDFTKESHSADNNRIDFLSGDFIIETKQLDISNEDWKGVTQLMDYLNKENKRFGYLVVYLHNTKNEDEDKRFKFDKEIYTMNEKVIKLVLIDIRIRKPKKEDKVFNELSTASQITSFINLTLDNYLTIIKA